MRELEKYARKFNSHKGILRAKKCCRIGWQCTVVGLISEPMTKKK
jgi:hypothetical protein